MSEKHGKQSKPMGDSWMAHFQQKQVLAFREDLLPSSVTPEEREQLDRKTFERLKHVSPEGLSPILIQRNHEDWIAAYLIQDVGLSSKRFLVKAQTWRIQWAKKSAKILRVPEEGRVFDLFNRIVTAQEERFGAIEQLQEAIRLRNGSGSAGVGAGSKRERAGVGARKRRHVLRAQQKLVGTAS